MTSAWETGQAAALRHLQATNLNAYTAARTHYKSSHQPLHPRGNPAAALKPRRRSLVIFEVRTYISVYMNCFLVLCIVKA